MWKSTEYCTFSTSWNGNHDPSFLSTYSMLQAVEDWSCDLPETDDALSTTTSITCTCEDDPPLFELICTCKPHHLVQIIGTDIVSEARTLELYTEADGYLKSSRGKLVIDDGNGEDQPQNKLYCCRIKLDEPVDKLIIKFLGLNNRSSFTIYRLEYILLHIDGNSSVAKNIPGTIDMTKVKGYLHSMGDTVPDNAMQLLHSVEQYQKSQMSSLANVFSSAPSTLPGRNSSDSLTGLLSLVTRIGSLPTVSDASQQSCDNSVANESEGQQSCDTPMTNDQIHVNDSTQSNLGPLQTLMMAMSGSRPSQGHSGTEGQGQDTMYKMLQGICGKVSDIRKSEQDKAGPVENTEHFRSENPDEHSADNSPSAVGIKAESNMADINMEQLQTALEKTVSQMIHSSEERLVKYIDTSLSAMEMRLNNKLDSMMQTLQKNGHSSSS